MEELSEYCEQDVEITRKVFLAGWQDGFLYYYNKGRAGNGDQHRIMEREA